MADIGAREKPPRQEQRVMPANDVQGRTILLLALGLVLVLGVVGTLAYLAWNGFRPAGDYSGPNAAFDFQIDGPVLESAPQADRKAYEAAKQQHLDSWGWTDAKAGIARIPIGQAMRLMAGQGRTGSVAPKPEETERGWEAVRP